MSTKIITAYVNDAELSAEDFADYTAYLKARIAELAHDGHLYCCEIEVKQGKDGIAIGGGEHAALEARLNEMLPGFWEEFCAGGNIDFHDCDPGCGIGSSHSENLVYLGDTFAVDTITGEVYDGVAENEEPFLHSEEFRVRQDLLTARPINGSRSALLHWISAVRKEIGVDEIISSNRCVAEMIRHDAERAVLAANPDLRHLRNK